MSGILRVLVVAGLTALVGAGGAQAAQLVSDAGDSVVVHEAAFEQPMDAQGRPLGPPVAVEPGSRRPTAAAWAVARHRPPDQPRARVRSLQGSGCKTVNVYRYGSSFLFGTKLWEYHQEKYFCWSYPRVTSVQTQAYPCCTDPTWKFMGTTGSKGWFFTWSGSSSGGHYSFRQGRFDQVVLGTTVTSVYPWTKIWAYGDGSWSYATGD